MATCSASILRGFTEGAIALRQDIFMYNLPGRDQTLSAVYQQEDRPVFSRRQWGSVAACWEAHSSRRDDYGRLLLATGTGLAV